MSAQEQQIIQSCNTCRRCRRRATRCRAADRDRSGQQNYAGIAPQAAQVVDLSATQSQQQGYINTINTVTTRLKTMSLAMQNISTIATSFQNTLATSAFNTRRRHDPETGAGLLAEIGNYLNTQDGDGYVFSGNQTSTAPFDPAGLPNPGDLVTQWRRPPAITAATTVAQAPSTTT